MEKMIPETIENEAAVEMKPAAKKASRGLYAFLEVLAAAAGTMTALRCALIAGVANLMDVTGLSAKEIEEISPWSWAAKFTDEDAQSVFMSRNITLAIVFGLLAVGAVAGLCIMTGRFSRDEDGNIKLNRFDRIWRF